MSKTDWTDPGDLWKRIEEDADNREANLEYARQAIIHSLKRSTQLRILQVCGHMSQYEALEALEAIEREQRG